MYILTSFQLCYFQTMWVKRPVFSSASESFKIQEKHKGNRLLWNLLFEIVRFFLSVQMANLLILYSVKKLLTFTESFILSSSNEKTQGVTKWNKSISNRTPRIHVVEYLTTSRQWYHGAAHTSRKPSLSVTSIQREKEIKLLTLLIAT